MCFCENFDERLYDSLLIYSSPNKVIRGFDFNWVYVNYSEFCIEPLAYDLLGKNEITVLKYKKINDAEILLERIGENTDWHFYRRGEKNEVFKELGSWYKNIHSIKKAKNDYELPCIAQEDSLRTSDIDSWIGFYIKYLERKKWVEIIHELNRMYTNSDLCYIHNDFCYKNIINNLRKKRTIMFDFDKSGWGIATQDIIAIKELASKEEFSEFIKGYGAVENKEIMFAELINTLEVLKTATQYEKEPIWAKDALWLLKSGQIYKLFLDICQ